MDSTGEILRRARNERHLTLDELAIRTRINRKYLAALESGDKEAIPGGFFYKSFARQYAMALSTDEDNVVEKVEESMAAEEPVAPLPPDEEVLKALAVKAEENGGGRGRGTFSATAYAILLVLAIVGTSGLYVLWHRAQQAQAADESSRPVPQQRAAQTAAPAPQPAAQQPATAAPQLPAQSAPTESQPQPAPTETASQQPASVPTEQPPPTQPQPQPTSAEPTQTAVAAPTPPPNPEDKIALNVSAREMTWFSVTADGKKIFSGVLQPGQSRAFAAHENAKLRVGNASGLEVVYNGKPMGVLGAQGQVVNVLVTPENAEVEKPVPPTVPGQPPQQPPPQF